MINEVILMLGPLVPILSSSTCHCDQLTSKYNVVPPLNTTYSLYESTTSKTPGSFETFRSSGSFGRDSRRYTSSVLCPNAPPFEQNYFSVIQTSWTDLRQSIASFHSINSSKSVHPLIHHDDAISCTHPWREWRIRWRARCSQAWDMGRKWRRTGTWDYPRRFMIRDDSNDGTVLNMAELSSGTTEMKISNSNRWVDRPVKWEKSMGVFMPTFMSSFQWPWRRKPPPMDVDCAVRIAIDERHRQLEGSPEYRALRILEGMEKLEMGKRRDQKDDRNNKKIMKENIDQSITDVPNHVDTVPNLDNSTISQPLTQISHLGKLTDPDFQRRWSSTLGQLLRISDRVTSGNRLTILTDGDDIFDSMLSEIDRASMRVWIESYIFDGSKIAKRFVRSLIDAQKRGCDCVLIYDWLGSWDTDHSLIQELRDNGVTVVVFNELSYFAALNRRRLAFRDHRKIAVIDDVGFGGSANISREAGGKRWGTSRFWDIHLKIEGPAVAHLGEVFRSTLIASESGVTRPAVFPAPAPIDEKNGGGSLVQILESNRRRGVQEIQKAFELVIRNAGILDYLNMLINSLINLLYVLL